MNEAKKDQNIIKKEQINDFAGLFDALKRVHIRLINEGYTINSGKITPPRKKPCSKRQ